MLQLLYCHGFASSPLSSKGRALASLFPEMQRLDLRVSDRHRLRLSAMIDVVRAAIPEGGRALAVGSSLGGLTVARAAERDPRIVGVVLIAPAFRLVPRWRVRTGEPAWEKWKAEGTMRYVDHAAPNGHLDVDFGFVEDAMRTDGDDAPEDAQSKVGKGPRWPDVLVPTTILHGTRDVVVEPELSRTYAATRPFVKHLETDDDHQMNASVEMIAREIEALRGSLLK